MNVQTLNSALVPCHRSRPECKCGSKANGNADYYRAGNKADDAVIAFAVKVVGHTTRNEKSYQNITTAEEMSPASGSADIYRRRRFCGLPPSAEEILAQRMENDAVPTRCLRHSI